MTDDAHSALYFTPSRDHWHSASQLARCVDEWELGSLGRVLDLGCGKGHWSRALGPHLTAMHALVGLDAEQAWVDAVVPAWRESGLKAALAAVRGDIHALPFQDQSFDLVTCQTVLIHAADPVRMLTEARRVLRPGGKLLVCEPNNLANVAAELAATPAASIDTVLSVLRFQLLCQRGKIALGLGDNSFGEQAVAAATRAGLRLVGARLVEKVHSQTPPYSSPLERQGIAEQRDLAARGIAGWPREEAHRYFEAGQGSADGFDDAYDEVLRHERSVLDAVNAGTYARSGGTVQYLICAAR